MVKRPGQIPTIKHGIKSLTAKTYIVERVRPTFQKNHALPDTSMKLTEFVLQTILVKIFSLAIANFSSFKMATGNFKMAAKFIELFQSNSIISF